MKNITFSKRKIFSSILAGLLICSFVLVPVSQTLEIKKAEAITVWDPGNYVPNWGTFIESSLSAISDAASASNLSSLTFKEYILDTIAWQLANIMLQKMIQDTTRWVNSGFKGSPAFVSNLESYMINVADQVAGNIIWGGALNGLCSPFKLDIQLALDIQYAKGRGDYKAQCTFTQVTKNIESFLDGDFVSGDWDDWYDVTMRPENNPYGAMLQAQTGLSLGISNSQKRSELMLNFGNGFLTSEKCTGEGSSKQCQTITPGAVIEGQLNSSLAGGQRRIEVADELNELVGALLSQLVSSALSGTGGLLGLTNNSGDGDYFDKMANEQPPSTYTGVETENPFPNVISTQKTYLDLQNQIINLITDVIPYKDDVYGDSCRASGALTSSLTSKLDSAKASKASVTTLIGTLTGYNTDYTLLRSTTTPAETTAILLVKYNAKNTFEALNKLMSQYSSYTVSGSLHTNEENVRLSLEKIPDLKTEISNFKTQIDMLCRNRR